MKYLKAKEQLQFALKNQQSIKISKLSQILQSLNISLKEPKDNREVRYLKNEVTKLHKAIEKKNRTIKRLEGVK